MKANSGDSEITENGKTTHKTQQSTAKRHPRAMRASPRIGAQQEAKKTSNNKPQYHLPIIVGASSATIVSIFRKK